MNERLPRKEKRELLDAYRRSVLEKTERFAEIRKEAIRMIQENPDIPYEELKREIFYIARDIYLEEDERTRMECSLDTFNLYRENIRTINKRFPSDVKLFRHLTGSYPKGNVIIRRESFYLVIIPEKDEDYERIAKINKKEESSRMKEIISSSDGAFIEPLSFDSVPIIFLRKNEDKILIHEETHAFNWLLGIGTTMTESGYDDIDILEKKEGEERRTIERYARFIREFYEESDLADEIFAFKFEGEENEYITELLLNSEIYRRKNLAIEKIKDKYKESEELEEIIEKVFTTEYKELIVLALDALDQIKKIKGFNLEETRNYLVNTPIRHWSKLLRRIKENEKESHTDR